MIADKDKFVERTMTGKELAEKLNIHPATVRLWRTRGLPHTQLNQRLFRYNYQEVIEWTQQRLATGEK